MKWVTKPLQNLSFHVLLCGGGFWVLTRSHWSPTSPKLCPPQVYNEYQCLAISTYFTSVSRGLDPVAGSGRVRVHPCTLVVAPCGELTCSLAEVFSTHRV